MQMNLYTVELQRDEPSFSDATTIGEFSDIRTAIDRLESSRGHRRLIGWLDMGAMRSPVELIRL